MSVSYCISGRFANNLIQYFAAKVLCKLTGKKYEYKLRTHSQKTIGDIEYLKIYDNIKNNKSSLEGYILLTEFFQQKEWILQEREYLLSLILIDNEDSINDTYKVSDLAKAINENKNMPENEELVIHVRLDDYFHQGHNSDIIDPYSLSDYVNTLGFREHKIVCDVLRQEWEKKYIDILLKNIPNCKVVNNSLLEDFSIMYYAKNIVLSRSTFSWMASILSPYTINSWFPLRNFKCNRQTIDTINERTINFTPKYLINKP
jgi:hypothetical protein